MYNSRIVLVLVIFFSVGIVIVLILINLPRTQREKNEPLALYPTSIPEKRTIFPSNPPLPVFKSDTTKYQILGDILYDFSSNPQLPTKMAGYSVDSYSITLKQAISLANNFGFGETPSEQSASENEQVLLWRDEETRLTIALQSGTIEYFSSYTPGKSASVVKVTSKEELLKKATVFLQSHGLSFPDVTATGSDIAYFTETGSEPTSTTTFDEATLFSVSYKRKLNHIPVVTNYGDSSQILVWLDLYGNVKKASVQYAAVRQGTTQALMNIAMAKTAVPTVGSIVHLGDGDRSVETANLTTTTFTNVYAAYFDDRSNQLFYPIYVFTGNAISKNGNVYEITVYLPAFAR